MFEHLEKLEATERTSLVEGVRNFGLRNPGRGILVLVTDLMDKRGYDEALRYLTARRMDAYIVHILSREELHPDVAGDLRLIDAEDEQSTEITVGDSLLKAYERTLAAFLAEARETCARRSLNYAFVDNHVSIERFTADTLRRQGLTA
jgi:prepilin-type processing-associated H-X9-DG protein